MIEEVRAGSVVKTDSRARSCRPWTRIANVSGEAGGDRGVYSIGAVARMLGVPAATIRNWEERYAAVVPERSEGGHRLYSRDQVDELRFVAAEVSGGLSAADAHRLLEE